MLCIIVVFSKRSFVCRNTETLIVLPEIIKEQKHDYEEGTVTLLVTKDKVVIEFYCGGNYIPHISNNDRYILLTDVNGVQFGIDKESNLFWRKDGNLIYSNCKASDTLKYNKIFDNKIIKKLEK